MSHDYPIPRTVLYVEDNDVNALLMQALFDCRPDLRLVVAHNCAAALHCARAQRLDLLLLDLRLPDGNGSTLLPQLRALPGLQLVPAVAVTAEDLSPSSSLPGFDSLWIKPLNVLQVLDDLNHWLPRRSSPPAQARPGPAGPGSSAAGMAMG